MRRGLLKGFRWRRSADLDGPRQLLLLELSEASSRAVGLQRRHRLVRWDSAVELPPLDLQNGGRELIRELDSLGLDREYVSVVSLLPRTASRLISFPAKSTQEGALSQQVRQTLGVEMDTAVTHQVISRPDEDRGESLNVLAAVMPKETVQQLDAFVTDLGAKSVSLTVGSAALANLIQSAAGTLQQDAALGFLNVGQTSSDVLLYRGQDLAFSRHFSFGESTIVDSVMQEMKLDRDTAEKMYRSGSFDIQAEAGPVISSWLHQLQISFDFFERRHGRPVGMLYLFGDGAESKVIESIVSSEIARPLMRWNPLQNIENFQINGSVPTAGRQKYLLALGEGLRIMSRGINRAD